MNSDRAQDSSVMEASQIERTRSRDIQTQRLKNRERQRRYRARKRLESDMKKSCSIKQSTALAPPVVEVQLNAIISNYIPRVYCKRDWKKDARRAHVSKDPEVTPNGCAAPMLTPTSENKTVFLPGNLAEPVVDSETHAEVSVNQINSEMHKPKIGRRDWKADARKKTNESGLQIGKGLSW